MIGDILDCPHCGSPVQRNDDQWLCETHGCVAKQRGELVDFLYDTAEISLANSGVWNLSDDQRMGLQLLEMLPETGYLELKAYVRRQRTDEGGFVTDPQADLKKGWFTRRAQNRFNSRYQRVSEEVGGAHGEQILHKVETRLRDLDHPPMPGNLAIEVAGGDGQYLSGFCKRFEYVVFIDGSLVNVVLAQALARDGELTNVGFVRADILSLPIRSSRASMVHVNNVIEHVSEPQVMVSECARATSPDGYTVVVSPNRTSVFFEPHFRLPLYGLIPRPVRLCLIPITRGTNSEAGTSPLSLKHLRRVLRTVHSEWEIFVAPRGIQSTARNTLSRRTLVRVLQSPVGGVADWLLNRGLLPIAPCHTAIGRVRN